MEVDDKNLDKIKNIISAIENLDLKKCSIEDIEDLIVNLLASNRLYITAPNWCKKLDIYRGRIVSQKPLNISEITYPPPEKVKCGRLNNIGESIFYGASFRNVVLFELNANVNDVIIISKWRTRTNLLTFHLGFTEQATELLKAKRDLAYIYKFIQETRNFNHLNKLVYDYLSSKFMEKISQWEEYKYKPTIAIKRRTMDINFANNNIFSINGMLYPSTATYGNADNIAIKPSYVDKHLQFVNAELIKITKKHLSVNNITYSYDPIDTVIKLDRRGNILWSGREKFQWTISQNGGVLHLKSYGDGLHAYDINNGNEIDPE